MSTCTSITRIDGMTNALCVDDITGSQFEYLDLEGNFPISADSMHSNSTDLLATVYHGTSDLVTSNVDVSDTIEEFFKACRRKVSGACSNTHALAWTGTISSLAGVITQIITAINNRRENKAPRSMCTNYRSGGTVRVSWALYDVGRATDDQIKAISEGCAMVCDKNNWSCEVRLVQGSSQSTAQYFCVSDRAKGCPAQHRLDDVCA